MVTPNLPDIDGVDSFAGVTMHTARWDHQQDLTGKRVAIIGTGASAVQVIPEIAPIVEQLTVFQRTPIWCFPKLDVPLSPMAQRMMRLPGGNTVQRLLSQAYVELTFTLPAQYFTVNPMAKKMSKVGEAYLRKQVEDSEVRDKLTPRYAVGCKRPGFHNTYLSTYNRDNVELVTEPIDKITGSGVATADGETRDVDVLILATGFRVMDADDCRHIPLTGSGGLSWSEHWNATPTAGLRGCQRARLPELLHRLRPLRLCRIVVLRPDRDADAPHHALPQRGSPQERVPRRGHAGGQ